MFEYLKTHEVLEGKSYIVRDSLATVVLAQLEQRSFRDMAVLTHTSLIVVPIMVETSVDTDVSNGASSRIEQPLCDRVDIYSSTEQLHYGSPVTASSTGHRQAIIGELIDLTMS